MTIIQASFYFENDKPAGLGLTFGPPGFTPADLEAMFRGEVVRDYFRDSDQQLGTNIVETYLGQLRSLAAEARRRPLSLSKAILAALNIMWLAERGFLVQDEFNGTQFVLTNR